MYPIKKTTKSIRMTVHHLKVLLCDSPLLFLSLLTLPLICFVSGELFEVSLIF